MLKIIYILTNRGRTNKTVLPALLKQIKENKHFIMVLDEADATDKSNGLDGRKIFKLVQSSSPRKDINIYIPEDPNINIGFITSQSINLASIDGKQINKLDLLFPQGKSEHYQHWRIVGYFNFNKVLQQTIKLKGINIIAQHNSAFIRPLRRAIQSTTAMALLSRIQKKFPNIPTLLIRDQNTWIPGEGKFERLIRKIFNVVSLTDNMERCYYFAHQEADTGGLNRLLNILYKAGIITWISTHIIKLADRIETISIKRSFLHDHNNIIIQSSSKYIKDLDHDMISVSFN